MSAPPDAMTQLLQGLLGGDQSSAPQGGLMAAINQALAPYGGSSQVALSLLGNKSGGSSPMSVLGQSLQDSQKSALDNQAARLKNAQAALALPGDAFRAQLFSGQPMGPALGGIQPVGAQGQPGQAMQPGQAPAPQQGAPGAPLGMPGNPFSQSAQPSNLPVPQERQAPPTQTSFDVPQVDMASIPVDGKSPQTAANIIVALRKDMDPTTAAEAVTKRQQQLAEQYAAPKIDALDSVIKSASPTQMVSANPQLAQLWRQLAPNIGVDPANLQGFTDANVRQAFNPRRNELAAWAKMPRSELTPQDIQSDGPLGAKYSTNPITGEIKQEVAPQETATFLGKDGKPVMLTKAQGMQQGLQPYNQVSYGAAQMAGGPADLLAALAAKGVSLPGNGRNMTQTSATLNALMRNNPDKTPDQIADMVRMGQLDFNGAKRSTAQIATLAAATDIQSNQLQKNFDSLAPLVQKNGIPIVNGWINSLQRNLTPSGDKDATAAQGYLLAIAGEYAKLRSGSTGAAAPAEGEMRESLNYIKSALTQGGFDGARSALVQEAQNKRASVREGLQNASAVGTAVGNGPQISPPPAGAPKEGATATSKSGKPMVFQSGHWQYQ